jgi:hypothetical protein
MSEASKFYFGPLPDLTIDLSVGGYLRTVVSASERSCLRDFLINLQANPVPVGRSVTARIWHFHQCNHIIEIKITAQGRGVVTNIYRDITSDLASSLG